MTILRRVMLRRGVAIGAVAALIVGACRPAARGTNASDTAAPSGAVTPSPQAGLIGPTWTLVELNGQPAPSGAGDRPATLIFAAGTDPRAAGFAGCNRWFSGYTLGAPDRIQFTAAGATKMACSAGMELEQRFLGMLTASRGYTVDGGTLVLRNDSTVHARFVAR